MEAHPEAQLPFKVYYNMMSSTFLPGHCTQWALEVISTLQIWLILWILIPKFYFLKESNLREAMVISSSLLSAAARRYVARLFHPCVNYFLYLSLIGCVVQ